VRRVPDAGSLTLLGSGEAKQDGEKQSEMKLLVVLFSMALCFGLVSMVSCGSAPPSPAAGTGGVAAKVPSPTSPATSTSVPLPAPVSSPITAPADGQEEMLAAILSALHSVSLVPNRSESESVLASGTTVTTTVEYVPPGSKHFFSHDGEMLVVDGKVYSRGKGAGDWTVVQMDAEQISYPDFGGDFSDVRFLGQEALQGRSMLVYSARSAGTNSGTVSEITLWIGPDDGLLYMLVNNGEVGSLDSGTGELKMVKAVTTIGFVYDPTIEIAAPTQ